MTISNHVALFNTEIDIGQDNLNRDRMNLLSRSQETIRHDALDGHGRKHLVRMDADHQTRNMTARRLSQARINVKLPDYRFIIPQDFELAQWLYADW
jgi:hypothetical protein